jgi:hyperosmotically inducible protein
MKKEKYSISLMAIMMVVVVAVSLLALGMPAYASKTDDRIETSAKKSYVFKTYLKADDIKIQSKDGAVTLTGAVSEESHKSLAQETVAGLPGVKSVDNKLTIKGAPTTANSDAWVTTKVKTLLLFHQNVSSMTEVNTTNGIVTLKGEATSNAQKDLTTEYVKDVDGVKDVKNDMIVSKTSKKKGQTTGGKIDDASITAQVKMVLLYHRSTSAIKTSVTTKRGVVTLTGKAKNAAEKDLAAKFVKDVKGVKSVKNKMTIGS